MTYQPGGDAQDAPKPPPLPDPNAPGQGLPEVVPGQAPLPAYRAPAQPPVREAKSEPLIAFMGDIVRTGRWNAPRKTNTLMLMGDVKLDLRQELAPGETLEVESWALMGDIKIVVPPGTDVVISGGTLLGDVKTESDQREQPVPRAGSRVIVKGYTLMGDVTVREMGQTPVKPPRGWRWVNPKS